jgi:hypothetical protein
MELSMGIAYSWTFPQFDVAPSEDGLTDVVKTIHWRLDAIDAGITAGAYGTVALGEPSPGNFTPYADISEQWAIDQTSALIDVPAIEAALAGEIAKKKNPPVVPMTPPFGS